MRISDWSSDVCSSDLHRGAAGAGGRDDAADALLADDPVLEGSRHGAHRGAAVASEDAAGAATVIGSHHVRRHVGRSEEHTSELQSLMRISYAVFCLKKKKQQNAKHRTN